MSYLKKMNVRAICLTVAFLSFGALLTNCDEKKDTTSEAIMQLLIVNSAPKTVNVGSNSCALCNSLAFRLFSGSNCSGSALQSITSLSAGSSRGFSEQVSGQFSVQVMDNVTLTTLCSNAFTTSGFRGNPFCQVTFTGTTLSSISCGP
ncbi:hypothetical protein [Leptospira stimsonii]|uniref:hypothetical protein n=1 Tax=Leptospira stimsonii TaxID=2202203 RepID=UPI0011C48C74|nr:hypothetical protein [Leptospira stimsonii]